MAINPNSRYSDTRTLKDFNIVKTKMRLFSMYVRYFYNVLMERVKINGLPDTMPEDDIKYILYRRGCITIGKDDNEKLYGFNGEMGGEPNPYYLPTISVVANPALNLSKHYTIGVDCVVVKNDSMYAGYDDIICLYSSLLATIDISMYWTSVATRSQKLYESGNDDVKKSIEEVFNSLEDGDKLKVIAGKPLFEFIKTQDYSNSSNATNNMKGLIELKQYIWSKFFQLIGLPSNGNMKRESLNENELDADIYTIIPSTDNVLRNLREGFDEVNKMFGTSISVELASATKQIVKETELRIEEQEKQIEEMGREANKEEEINNEENKETTEEKSTEESTTEEKKEEV